MFAVLQLLFGQWKRLADALFGSSKAELFCQFFMAEISAVVDNKKTNLLFKKHNFCHLGNNVFIIILCWQLTLYQILSVFLNFFYCI